MKAITVAITGRSKRRAMVLSGIPLLIRMETKYCMKFQGLILLLCAVTTLNGCPLSSRVFWNSSILVVVVRAFKAPSCAAMICFG